MNDLGVRLRAVQELMPQVEGVLSRVFPQIELLVPNAELHHIGSTALPSALTKGDVDVLLRVSPAILPQAVSLLRRHFTIKQPTNWTSSFASFGDDISYELPLGIQVVVKNSTDDFFLFLHDYLMSNPDAFKEYNCLKVTHAGEGPEGYWRAKDKFLSKVLAMGGF
jgi:GrpB-like predicted nucleotidyltransferase (UPF0157 family)